MRLISLFPFAASLMLAPTAAMAAAIVDKVQIKGLDGSDAQKAMAENIRVALTFNETLGQRLGDTRVEYLMEQTKDEATHALEPFGYYSPTVEVTSTQISDAEASRLEKEAASEKEKDQGNGKKKKSKKKSKDDEQTQVQQDSGDTAQQATSQVQADTGDADDKATTASAPSETSDSEGATAERATAATQSSDTKTPRKRPPASHIVVTVTVTLGEPVRVRQADIHIDGDGGQDQYLAEDLKAFTPKKGDVFDHQTYEASKLKIVRRLADRGYLDADFENRKVEITRAEHTADIDLSWVSGIRYNMGPTTFHQDYFRPKLLQQLVYWDEGSYFHQGKLDRLRQSLVSLDYFSNIDIEPNPDAAVDGRVPIDVNLKLAPQTIYQYGVSYGTEYGAGFLAGMERRYVNSRGHKLKMLLDYAQNRKTLTTSYRIPAFKWLDGWYAATAQLYDEQTDYIDTRRIELIGSRSGQINEQWTATASIHALRERWRLELEDDAGNDTTNLRPYRTATYVYPQLEAQYVNVDDQTFPRAGIAGTIIVRGGLQGAGSDTNFGQVLVRGRWFQGVGANDRFILRGEVGQTTVASADALPPSLRLYAGGDNSIRGYQYREVGPRVRTQGGQYSVGGNKLITGSMEYEHYFHGGPFGAALFVDSGSAYNSTPDFKTGVGFGVRYKSPIGPVRVDIAHGLDDPDSPVQLYLSIGASL